LADLLINLAHGYYIVQLVKQKVVILTKIHITLGLVPRIKGSLK